MLAPSEQPLSRNTAVWRVVDGKNGQDGEDGQNGQDGQDGRMANNTKDSTASLPSIFRDPNLWIQIVLGCWRRPF